MLGNLDVMVSYCDIITDTGTVFFIYLLFFLHTYNTCGTSDTNTVLLRACSDSLAKARVNLSGRRKVIFLYCSTASMTLFYNETYAAYMWKYGP